MRDDALHTTGAYLRRIAEDDFGALGDTSTLADPSVVDDLIDNRMNKAWDV